MMLAAVLLALQAPPPSARDLQRLELRRDVLKLNGVWKMHEWGHYFVLTDVVDPRFLDQLERHTYEARETCSRLFPESESDPVRDDRKLVVLRVMRSKGEYQSYGGPGGSSGYWSTPGGEIVVHDDERRDQTWESLAGCIASAYLDELFGNSPRADWFELGLSEYCIASVCEHKRGPDADEIGNWPSLEGLLALPHNDWLSNLNEVPSRRLVAGSFMRFLCAEDSDRRWAKIPERYAVGWVALNDEAKARAFAFQGVDLAALECAWRASLTP